MVSQDQSGGPDAALDRLRLTEIFLSLQGESLSVGERTVFIRTTGCPLRCRYCDTAYAFGGGAWSELDSILEQVAGYGAEYVTLTGGEPLAQAASLTLLRRLCDAGYRVSLETSGERDISQVDARVVRVMDLKTPGSGEQPRNRLANLAHLTSNDQIKFVLCDRTDYDWAAGMVAEHKLAEICPVLFSPVWDTLPPADLAEWILADGLRVRLQLQLHKVLWGETPGR
ncbi:MAG: 7-carboxy-7-deazaguanine synthase QueE [Gammaproteobacteria bacterium]|nr:7-carboxy-7-deazaguanine synthase QueE [Gammaproteobacteria bacterium]